MEIILISFKLILQMQQLMIVRQKNVLLLIHVQALLLLKLIQMLLLTLHKIQLMIQLGFINLITKITLKMVIRKHFAFSVFQQMVLLMNINLQLHKLHLIVIQVWQQNLKLLQSRINMLVVDLDSDTSLKISSRLLLLMAAIQTALMETLVGLYQLIRYHLLQEQLLMFKSLYQLLPGRFKHQTALFQGIQNLFA